MLLFKSSRDWLSRIVDWPRQRRHQYWLQRRLNRKHRNRSELWRSLEILETRVMLAGAAVDIEVDTDANSVVFTGDADAETVYLGVNELLPIFVPVRLRESG